MEEIYVSRISEVRGNKERLEKELDVKIYINGRKVVVDGESINEYEAELVLSAINFGFKVKYALMLKDEEVAFQTVHIKSHTRRNLKDVRARLIGIKGKTKRTMEEISGCKIIINDNEVGIIGYVDDVENVVTAVTNLIKGSKQSNMYAYLERMNRRKKELGKD